MSAVQVTPLHCGYRNPETGVHCDWACNGTVQVDDFTGAYVVRPDAPGWSAFFSGAMNRVIARCPQHVGQSV